MNSIVILLSVVGFFIVVVALGLLLPQLAIDSPWELFLSLIGWNRTGNFLELAHEHIRAEWPHTKGIAILLYGGLILLVGPALVCWIIPDLIKEIRSAVSH